MSNTKFRSGITCDSVSTGAISATAVTLTSVISDTEVVPTILVGNATGGATAATLTLALKNLAGTAITSARTVHIYSSSIPNVPFNLVSTITFATATKGSIVASGGGMAVVTTDANGEFACTCSNSADGTFYFSVVTAWTISDATKRCTVHAGVEDTATWAA